MAWTSSPPSLMALSFEVLLAHVHTLSCGAVTSLPEHVQLGLFEGVLARGKLTERLLDVFVEAARRSESEPLARRIQSLNLRPLPPRPTNSRARWLGEDPSWY